MTSPSGARCGLQVQAESASFAPGGGPGTLRVSTARECAWTARSGATWVSLASAASGQGEGTVQFAVARNADPTTRSSSIEVNDARLQVSQEGSPCQLGLSSAQETFDATGGRRTIQVVASSPQCTWTASADVAWIEIRAGREGAGNGLVSVEVHPADALPRTGTVIVAGHPVRVDQTPLSGPGPGPAPGPGPGPGPSPSCSYALVPGAISIGASGGPSRLDVATGPGCGWTADTQSPWIAITGGQTGSGPGELRMTIAPSTGPARTGTVRVGTAVATITQGEGCSFGMTPSTVTAAAAGASGTLQVTAGAGCAWTAGSGAGWISLTGPSSGAGAGQVAYVVAPNTGPARQTTMTIGGQAVRVTQASGCTYAVSPDAVTIAAGGGGSTLSLTTGNGCQWAAESSAPWLSFPASTGSGPGAVPFTAAANAGEPRRGTMTIAGRTVTVTQASPCTWSFAPPDVQMPAFGGTAAVLVLVTGPCGWTAVSGADWIAITAGAAETGNGLVLMTIAPNPGTARSGTAVIGGSPYTITQQGR